MVQIQGEKKPLIHKIMFGKMVISNKLGLMELNEDWTLSISAEYQSPLTQETAERKRVNPSIGTQQTGPG